MDIDFGFSVGNNVNTDNPTKVEKQENNVTNLTTGVIEHESTEAPVTKLENNEITNSQVDTEKTSSLERKGVEVKSQENDRTKATELVEGTTVEVGDQIYTVDDKGNLIDKDGKLFKEAEHVNAWLEEMEVEDSDSNTLSINDIQKAMGFEFTDENNNPVQFENTTEGVKAFIDAIIEKKREEHYETAINTLYQKYPILNDVLNYYVANGNSLDGFGVMPDRSNITIDTNNVEQQKEIIRTAWNEQNRKGDVESYINYLDASGILYATAKEELEGLQQADADARKQLEKEAERKEKENIENLQKYWNGVQEVIANRKIAGYQIPENIIINRNGQKISVTPNDFFNYLYRVDKDGYSAYERDLAMQTPESRRDDEILRAYLTFVGGNYSNLVDMAINKQQVSQLRLKAKEKKSNGTIRINRPTSNNKNVDFGY